MRGSSVRSSRACQNPSLLAARRWRPPSPVSRLTIQGLGDNRGGEPGFERFLGIVPERVRVIGPDGKGQIVPCGDRAFVGADPSSAGSAQDVEGLLIRETAVERPAEFSGRDSLQRSTEPLAVRHTTESFAKERGAAVRRLFLHPLKVVAVHHRARTAVGHADPGWPKVIRMPFGCSTRISRIP